MCVQTWWGATLHTQHWAGIWGNIYARVPVSVSGNVLVHRQTNLFGDGVQGRRCFVIQEDRWILKNCTGDGNTLLLPPWNKWQATVNIRLQTKCLKYALLQRVSVCPFPSHNHHKWGAIAQTTQMLWGSVWQNRLPFNCEDESAGLRDFSHRVRLAFYYIWATCGLLKASGFQWV